MKIEDLEYNCASKRVLKVAGKTQEAGKGQEGIPYKFQREHGLDCSLIPDFWPPKL